MKIKNYGEFRKHFGGNLNEENFSKIMGNYSDIFSEISGWPGSFMNKYDEEFYIYFVGGTCEFVELSDGVKESDCYESAIENYRTNYYYPTLDKLQTVKVPLPDGTNPLVSLDNIERYGHITRVDELQAFLDGVRLYYSKVLGSSNKTKIKLNHQKISK